MGGKASAAALKSPARRWWKVEAVASCGGGVTCEALDDGGAAAGADLFESVGRKERKRNVKYHT